MFQTAIDSCSRAFIKAFQAADLLWLSINNSMSV